MKTNGVNLSTSGPRSAPYFALLANSLTGVERLAHHLRNRSRSSMDGHKEQQQALHKSVYYEERKIAVLRRLLCGTLRSGNTQSRMQPARQA